MHNMKKRIFSIGLCCVLAFCLMMSSVMTASAANPEHLVTLDAPRDLSVVIWFDQSFPTVKLTKPDGSVIHVKQGAAGINLTVEAEWALVEVPSAAAGKWMIEIDKGSNTEVSYQLMNATENIWIQYLNVKADANGKAEATFLAEIGEEKTSYQYELYLTTTADDAGQKLLKEGSATTGEEMKVSLDLSEQTSYDQYALFLRVYKSYADYELFDECVSNSFAYTNPDAPKAPKGVDVRVELGGRMLTCNWDAYKEYRFDSYFIEVTAEGATEVLFFNEFSGDACVMTQYLDAAYTVFTVKFYGRDNGVLSEPVVREVRLDGDGCINIITPELTSQGQAQIKTDLPAGTDMTVTVGETESVFTSKGQADTVAVMIENGPNELTASAVVNDVQYMFKRYIFKDGVPPMLTFFEPYDGMNYSVKKLTIVGNVDDGVSLTMGGTAVPLDEMGNFTVDVDIKPGENALEFIAQDKAGNQTSRVLYLHGEKAQDLAAAISEFVSNHFPIVVAVAVGVAALTAAIILLIRHKKLKSFSFVTLVVVWSIVLAVMITGLVLSIVNLVQLSATVETVEFSNLVDESVSDAVAMLEAYEKAPDQVWLWTGLTAVAAVGLTVTIVVRCVMNKKKKAQAQVQEQPEKPQA